MKKNYLFVTPNSLSDNNGGTILFNTLFKNLTDKSIYWFICFSRPGKSLLNYNFLKIYFFNNSIFNSQLLNKLARFFLIFGYPWFFFKYRFVCKLSALKLTKIIKNNNFDKLWIYASQSSIPVSMLAIKKTNIKYHLTVQDDINTHLPIYESYFLSSDFKFLLENADTIDFISKDMETFYRQKYSIKAKSIVFLVNPIENIDKPIISMKIKSIGYSGNIWCANSFLPLLKAIKSLNKLHNTNIRVRIFTFHIPLFFFKDYEDIIEFQTTLNYLELLKELQKCDLLYLPMTFDPRRSVTNITSFPSKIVTYLNSGVPILNHSPINSSTFNFVHENNVGVSVVNLQQSSFEDLLLNETILGYEKRVTFSSNSKITLDQFNHECMIKSIKNLIFN